MYHHKEIEAKWRDKWNQGFVDYTAQESGKEKKYILVEFPFPSGSGLHVGHTKSYMALDIVARKFRMEGFEVLYPMGWDAFGLPAETYALTHNVHPRESTEKNIATFRNQIDQLGISFDWSREINTSDPKYYQWTQWIFLQLFRKGLAYQDYTHVWWSEDLKTVLANEEVIDGYSERGGYPCERVPLRQWMLAITQYAERLYDDLDTVDYIDIVKRQQRNWIGKSTGLRTQFALDSGDVIEVYTTRPDTLMGVTFLVLSPEHPLVEQCLVDDYREAGEAYMRHAQQKSELERQQSKEKTGVFTGSYAKHPLTGQEIPIWIGDYVLMDYGTGAIMAVPGHDERDYQFARAYDLPVIQVIDEEGILINSGSFTGLNADEAKEVIGQDVCRQNKGQNEQQFKLRDWVFSRQRYWGEPFPIIWINQDDIDRLGEEVDSLLPESEIYRQEQGVQQRALPVHPQELPVRLPDVESYQPQGLGEGPLAQAEDWKYVWYNLDTGRTVSFTQQRPGDRWVKGERETDTMPNWAGSSWYFLRYIDPHNQEQFADPAKLAKWMPVDIYNGGMEHTTLHLLYSRFWHKVLYDLGFVPTSEPYQRRISHGVILAEGGVKMSKSKGNTINPLEMCEQFGADALRVYIMFMGPYDEEIAWDHNGLIGSYRFLTKVFYWLRNADNNQLSSISADTFPQLKYDLHALIQKVSADIEHQKFNTAVSSFMEFTNTWHRYDIGQESFQIFLRLLAPFAPHLSEELWEIFQETSIHHQSWPQYDPQALEVSTVDYQIHINGKMRALLTVNKDTDRETIQQQSLELEEVRPYLEEKELKKHIVLPEKQIVIIAVT